MNTLRVDGVPVSAFILQTRSLEVTDAFGISRDYFKATWTFHKGFLRRRSLSLRRQTRQGRVTPADCDAAVAAFRKTVDLIRLHKINRVFNADQTAVFFEYLPKQSINRRGEETVWFRSSSQERNRVTGMLLGDSMGNKLVPFVTAKTRPSKGPETAAENIASRQGFGGHVWKEVTIQQRCHDVVTYANTRGWWNSDLSVVFACYHFGDRE